MPSHTMEMPRQIVVGEKNIDDIGSFLNSLKKTKKISLVSGSNVKKIVQKKIEASLIASKIKCYWYLAKTNDISFENMKRAVINGSAMASFCVEKFGTQKLNEINKNDVDVRINEFVNLVQFDIPLK